MRGFAVILTLAILAIVGAVLVDAVEPVVLVATAPLTIFLFFTLLFMRVLAGQTRAMRQAEELPVRGLRRPGRVCDALPYGSRSGGAVFQPEGAQMVLQVELVPHDGRAAERVTVMVVEPSERSRARIGSDVVVLQHPEAPLLRALEGFRPDGQVAHPSLSPD